MKTFNKTRYENVVQKIIYLIVVLILAGCMVPIQQKYVEQFNQVTIGMSKEELKELFPTTYPGSQQRSKSGKVVDALVLRDRQYDIGAGRIVPQLIFFYFADNRLASWGRPQDWREREPDVIIRDDRNKYWKQPDFKKKLEFGQGHPSAKVKKEYTPSGKLKQEGNYLIRKREGITMLYYKSGKLKAEYNYKNGKREGIANFYFESGLIRMERNYKNNKRDGIEKRYYESGRIKQIDTYKNGKKINRKEYDESGKLVKE